MTKGLRASGDALERLRRADLWVLDIDGVLLDPRPSFYRGAIETAVEVASDALGRTDLVVTEADIAAFKAAGGWNDDFDLATGLAWALIHEATGGASVAETGAQARGGLEPLLVRLKATFGPETLENAMRAAPPGLVRARAAVRYSGRERSEHMYGIDPSAHPSVSDEGLWGVEPILCDAARLRAERATLAFFTGRNRAETELAAERLGLDVHGERWVVDDGSLAKKPAPDGLLRLSRHAKRGLFFIGDSIDDQTAALRYRQARGTPDLVFARVVGEGALNASVEEAFQAGADLVVEGLDDIMNFLDKGDGQ